MKKICLFIFIVMLLSCNKDFSFSSDFNNTNKYKAIKESTFLKNPETFNNKKIELVGDFYMDFEHIYLVIENKKVFLDFDLYKNLKDKNGNELDGKKLLSFNGREIVVKGKYVNGITGHINCCEGKLIEIAYFGNP